MAKLALTLAISDYDHTRDLASGRVTVEGCELTVLEFPVEEIFYRFTLHREWQVSEMSFAKFAAQVAGERPDIVGLPVFPSRVFRLSNIYVNAGAGIEQAADLRGKRIGTPEWAQTASVYTRGWLVEEAGVALDEVDWRQAGVNQPGRLEKVALHLPDGVRLTPEPERALGEMLAAGDLDAVFSAHPPEVFLQGDPRVRRLFADYQGVEQAYYERRGIFPIMHVIALRRDVFDANPWVAGNLLSAFGEARDRSVARCTDLTASRIPVPWLCDTVERRQRQFGADYFPYGIEPTRRTLETFLRWCFEQGVTRRLLDVAELFPASVAGAFKV